MDKKGGGSQWGGEKGAGLPMTAMDYSP